MKKRNIVLEQCPACGNIPSYKEYQYGSNMFQYSYYCKNCYNASISAHSSSTALQDRFGYGVTSQTSKAQAARQWNAMVYRNSMRELKKSLKPPKIVDIVEMLKKHKACESQISKVKCMLSNWDLLVQFVNSLSSTNSEAARISKLVNNEDM